MTAMKCEFKNPATGIKDTPLRMLIKSFPDLAKKVFDKCMKSNLLNYGNDSSEVWTKEEYIHICRDNDYQGNLLIGLHANQYLIHFTPQCISISPTHYNIQISFTCNNEHWAIYYLCSKKWNDKNYSHSSQSLVFSWFLGCKFSICWRWEIGNRI